MSIAHSPLGASAAHRWVRCPASIKMCEGLSQGDSPHALEGTCAHELGERALRAGNDCFVHVGLNSSDAPGYVFSEEMAEYVQEYVDFVRSLKGDLYVEERVSYEHICPGGFGTADAIVVDTNHLHVVDLKYGTGLKVFAEENFQLPLYASGALAKFDPYGAIECVSIHIVQPRLDHIDTWQVPMEWLADYEKRASEAGISALSDEPRFGPSPEACRWCLAKSDCQALADYNKQTILEVFDEPEGAFKDAHQLSPETLEWALRRSKAITDWVTSLSTAAADIILDGGEVPGYKVVEGRSIRKWADVRDAERVLEAQLGDDAYKPQEIITVAQAEKVLGKKHPIFQTEVSRSPGKPTLVPESDKRPPLRKSATEAFENI